ncbi:MAG: hypothetical protein U0350_51335 [Caldilineaceae bacterium]
MDIEIHVHATPELFSVEAPQISYSEAVPNVLLLDPSRNMLMGIGRTPEDVKRESPAAYEAKKDVLTSEPIYDSNNFKPANTKTALDFFTFDVHHKIQPNILLSFTRRWNFIYNLQLENYERIPEQLRERFEFSVLKDPAFTRFRVRKLFIGGHPIDFVNPRLVKAKRKTVWQKRIASFAFIVSNLIGAGSVLGLFVISISYVLSIKHFISSSPSWLLILLWALSIITLILAMLIMTIFMEYICILALRKFLPAWIIKHALDEQKTPEFVKRWFVKHLLTNPIT